MSSSLQPRVGRCLAAAPASSNSQVISGLGGVVKLSVAAAAKSRLGSEAQRGLNL